MTIDSILEAGFRECRVPTGMSCDRFFQRPQRDDNGTRYYLNIEYYDNRQYGGVEGYQAEAQFYSDDFHINMSVPGVAGKDIDSVCGLFDSLWVKIGAGYARKNEE
jgi:hypothetical protein